MYIQQLPFLTPKLAGKPSLHFYGIYIVCMILLLYGLLVYDAWNCFFLSLIGQSEAEMQKQRYSPLPASGSVGGDSGQPLLPGWECQLVRGGKRLYTATRQTSWDRPSPEGVRACVSYALTHAITVSGFMLVTVSLPTSTGDWYSGDLQSCNSHVTDM